MASNYPSIIAISLLHNYGGTSDLTRAGVFAGFSAIAIYNAIELLVLCFHSFRCRNNTYFWSLLISSACIIPYCIGFTLLFFSAGVTPWLCVTLFVVGWYGMVTGQSVVLWSRLHMVLHNKKVLRGVLWMICIDAVILHISTTVVIYGTVAHPTGPWPLAYDIMERIELVGFCVQEFIISSIYVWETIKLLRLRPEGHWNGILHQLLVINIVILLLDIAVVIIEYVGLYAIQVSFKPLAYSVKLKLEYAILGKLIAVARGHHGHELHSSERGINEVTSFPSDGDRHPNMESPMHRPYSPLWLQETMSFGHSSPSSTSPTSSDVLRDP
ncbi:hypothetical protein N7491_001648 [Penicillium cf. griseofulvum]|uniref:DUF7703 domain-containing protein n=1 Tax=Penicillium cf. griseofulvum TaxID=2972120 RepID=A0A9W9JH91_9EURO|nr:hypothetical protein N7472_006777 [Penicillium cf. griseofulvum]KAJ5445566.1 hypothetical protein N7491_001648 [Penicillium cf. griseofulvum]KAJ5447288.1 hypothetical protein N7445_002109 [Penicillium cf. griseofulvum]